MVDRDKALEIKRASHRSFKELRDAARRLQHKEHEPFSTTHVQRTSVSYARRIAKEAGMSLAQIEKWAAAQMRPER